MSLTLRFRRMVFFQVMLSIVSFGIVERNPAMLLLTGVAGMLSWFVTEGPRGRSIPRWMINLGSLVAVFALALEVTVLKVDLVVAMGHFTIWLAILLLYARKSHREYAQLLVLSMLVMVGGSVLSVSVVYGALLSVYCVVAVLTLLLFHLKSSADAVTESMRRSSGQPVAGLNLDEAGRSSGWQLRVTATVIAILCAAVASVVFVTLPRQPDRQLPERLAIQASSKTGFAREVDLSRGGPGAKGHDAVMNITLRRGFDEIDGSDAPILVRGAVLDRYDPSTSRWVRHPRIDEVPGTQRADDILASPPPDARDRSAEIVLRDTSGGVIFTLTGTRHVWGEMPTQTVFSAIDGQLSMRATAPGALSYGVDWRDELDQPGLDRRAWLRDSDGGPHRDWPARLIAGVARSVSAGWAAGVDAAGEEDAGGLRARRSASWPGQQANATRHTEALRRLVAGYGRGWPVQPNRVARLTRRVLRSAGVPTEPDGPMWRDRVAQAIDDYFQREFVYRSDNPPPTLSDDPTISFLFDHRQGHCELFASASAAMLRSIGIPARLVSGFMATEYNGIGGYFVVRSGDAHAWVEYERSDGRWALLDATPAEAVAIEHARSSGWWTSIADTYEHLEFVWVRSVLAFDEGTRLALWGDVRAWLGQAGDDAMLPVNSLLSSGAWLAGMWRIDQIGTTALVVVALFLAVAVGVLVRVAMRRRARIAALRLGGLPVAQRRRLVRRLGFYLTMLEMLERHGFTRPAWQSPFAFAEELAEAHPMRFDPVLALTELFYEVRFGGRGLDAERQGRVRVHLRRLEQTLGR
ncbi:MAG: DUF3488 and transglutaminase-like domain-containing protein [Planctomycetota bacterium]